MQPFNFIDETLFHTIFPNDDAWFDYLLEFGVFYKTIDCPGFEKPMKRSTKIRTFVCGTKSCKKRRLSIRKHTFFFSSHLPFKKIMLLARLFLADVPAKAIKKLHGFTDEVLADYFSYFMQLISTSLNEEDTRIGGPGIIVEIDETKLGKRKYNRSHHVGGAWAVCGVERTEQRKLFCVHVDKRDTETLEAVIKKHVHEESIVYTDLWRGYSNIADMGYDHLQVNHSKHFKDPISGVHTKQLREQITHLKSRLFPATELRTA
jgi:transposase-like protein